MELLYFLYCAVPSSSLSEGVCNVYNGITGAIGCGYLRLVILEAHAQSALVNVHKSLLFLQLLIHQSRTALYAVHELTHTFAYVIDRLSEHRFQLALYLR